jgi:hypothetical protein
LRVQLQEINHATHGNYPGPQSISLSDHPDNTNPPKTNSVSPCPLLFYLRGPGPLFDLGKKPRTSINSVISCKKAIWERKASTLGISKTAQRQPWKPVSVATLQQRAHGRATWYV